MSWSKRKQTNPHIEEKAVKKVMKELCAEYRRLRLLKTIHSGLSPLRLKPSVSTDRFQLTWYSPEGICADFIPQKRLFPRIHAWINQKKVQKQLRRIPAISGRTPADQDI